MRWLLFALVATLIAAGSPGPRPLPNDGGANPSPGGPGLSGLDDAEPADDPNPDDPSSAQADFSRLVAQVFPAQEPEGDDEPEDLEEDDLAILLGQPLRWHTDYETVLALSERSGKPILARFR
jgi:hypothetical protein